MLRTRINKLLFILAILFSAESLFAATVVKCNAKKYQCLIRLEEGNVGNHVEVLDEKGRTIANGWIIKRVRSSAIVALQKETIKKVVQRGFPVLVKVDNEDSNLQWAASFPYNP